HAAAPGLAGVRRQELHLVARLGQRLRQRQDRLARPAVPGLEARDYVAEPHGRGGFRSLITLQGLPAQTVRAGTSLTTTERAPTTESSPMVTPGPTKTSAPSQAFSPIVMGFATR